VEQVATLRLEGPARRFATISEYWITGRYDARVADLSMISFADISLQKTAKTDSAQNHSDASANAPSSLSPPRPGSTSAVGTGFRR
jgi:hypothetical protein